MSTASRQTGAGGEEEASGSSAEVVRAQAVYDFEGTCDVELNLKRGDVVTVLRQDVGDGWWEGRCETDGKEGLFPETFVELIQPDSDDDWPAPPEGPELQEGQSTLPAAGDRKSMLDIATARKLLVTGQAPCIVAGPSWFAETPVLTVRVKNPRKDSKLSGMKTFIVYDIESFEAEKPAAITTTVSRRYKHFLWLHTSLLDLYPGVLVPILPDKQFTGRFEDEFIRARQEALERFLNRVARHPLLRASHAFNHFMVASSFQDWKFGKHNVRRSVVYSKPSKKLESPSYFFSLSFPANNVPYDRVVQVDNFSKFALTLRKTTNALRISSDAIQGSHQDFSHGCDKLGKALTNFACGRTFMPERRVSTAAASGPGVSSPATSRQREEAASSGAAQLPTVSGRSGSTVFVPSDTVTNWCWRKDCKEFADLMARMHGVGSAMGLLSKFVDQHKQDSHAMSNTLKEYVSMLQAIPTVVRSHEEAVEQLNVARAGTSRESQTAAERHCEVTSNITFAEINTFHESFLVDFDGMVAGFLQQQVDFHSQVAREYQKMLDHFQQSTLNSRDS